MHAAGFWVPLKKWFQLLDCFLAFQSLSFISVVGANQHKFFHSETPVSKKSDSSKKTKELKNAIKKIKNPNFQEAKETKIKNLKV